MIGHSLSIVNSGAEDRMSKSHYVKVKKISVSALKVIDSLEKSDTQIILRLPTKRYIELSGDSLLDWMLLMRSSQPQIILPGFLENAMVRADQDKIEARKTKATPKKR